MRWPARLSARKIDVAPALLAAVGASPPPGLYFDGRDLLPLREDRGESWLERTYLVQAHRGNAPESCRAFAVVGKRYKLVQALSFSRPAPTDAPLERYDLLEDPGETSDLAAQRPEIVEHLKAGYDRWLEDVSSSRGYQPVPFAIGSDLQRHATLTRQDWRMVTSDGWGRGQRVLGHWEVTCLSEGPYDATVTVAESMPKAGAVRIAFRNLERSMPVAPGAERVQFENLLLEFGGRQFQASLEIDSEPRGVWHVDLVHR